MMKKYILILLTHFAAIYLFGQNCISNDNSSPCCNGLISTDVVNGTAVNNERPALTNQYNWVYNTAGIPTAFWHQNLLSPFVQELSNYAMITNFKNINFSLDTLSMHPRYGWELLHMHTGYEPFSTTPIQSSANDRNSAYLLFYNRHSGKLRGIFNPAGTESSNKTQLNLSFLLPKDLTYLSSGLFNFYNKRGRMYALDSLTKVTSIATFMPHASEPQWTYADLEMAYDPCICNNQSKLLFNFKEYEEFDIYGESRMLGINTPVNTSGTSPLQNGTDYLYSYYEGYQNGTDFIPTGGIGIINSMNSIVANNNYPDVSALELLSKGMEGLGEIEGLSALKFFGKAYSYMAKYLNSGAENISFIESEGILRGKATNLLESGPLNNFELYQPGSKNSNNSSIPWSQYPFYNEAMGVFTLLETPEVDFYSDFQCCAASPYSHVYEAGKDYSYTGNKLGVSLKNQLKYAINPAANIDWANSKILASIEFDLYIDTIGSSTNGPLVSKEPGIKNFNVLNNGDTLTFNEYFEPSFNMGTPKQVMTASAAKYNWPYYGGVSPWIKGVVNTDFIQIDKLDDYNFLKSYRYATFLQPRSFNSGSYIYDLDSFLFLDPRLKIILDLKTLPNAYGQVNSFVQIQTYNVKKNFHYNELTNSSAPFYSKSIYGNYVKKGTIYLGRKSGGTIVPDITQDIIADSIVIIGDLTSSTGVTLIGLNGVTHVAGEISPTITLQTNNPFTQNGIAPVDNSFINNYCTTKYKANSSNKRDIDFSEIEKSNSENKFLSSKIYPNPTQNVLFFEVLNKEADISNTIINVYNMLGEEMFSKEYSLTSKGYIDLSRYNLSSGTYFVKINNGGYSKTHKFTLINN